MPKSSCAAEVVHTWTYNDHIIAQLRWCGGRPRHHVSLCRLSSTYGADIRPAAHNLVHDRRRVGGLPREIEKRELERIRLSERHAYEATIHRPSPKSRN